jgi:hypothetical protein
MFDMAPLLGIVIFTGMGSVDETSLQKIIGTTHPRPPERSLAIPLSRSCGVVRLFMIQIIRYDTAIVYLRVLFFNNREGFLVSLNSCETVTFFEVRSLYLVYLTI